jgi:glycosyltransferase involved in cell wall biosynthesis
MAERPMRVVFDGHALSQHRSGIGVYSHRLLEELIRGYHGDVEVHVYACGRIVHVPTMESLETAVRGVSDGDLYAFEHQWELPRLLGRHAYDIFHSPDFLFPFMIRRTAVVTTIHDLIPVVMRSYLRRSMKVRLYPLTWLSLRIAAGRARRVLTVSEHSRNDIMRYLRIPGDRIDVTPVGPMLPLSDVSLAAPFTTGLEAGKYFLYVGRHDPYKGIDLMLRAFAEAVRSMDLPDIRVVITGKEDERYPVSTEVRRLGLENRVLLAGYVQDDQLSALYRHALALVMPSLYEGFGVPPLDAMHHGTPVICSNRASLPEVVGDAALVVDPEDTGAFSHALVEIHRNATLRSSLITRGYERERRFSWRATAEATLLSYERALNR